MPPTPRTNSAEAQSCTHAANLPSLYAAEFANFCEAAHDITPYPWQMRLAQNVFESRQWPETLSLPCGAGRCVLVDIAIFHLALEADAGQDRQATLRIAHVLDRWTIHNSFFDHSTLLAERLNRSLGSSDREHILTRVARRLTFLAGSRLPLVVRTLAGGAPQEGDWTPSASQPTVVCSLIDTIGSRLLFRGYGVSASMKSLQAGLFGADCLLILDDVRSDAFRQTLWALVRLRNDPWTACAIAPWAVVDVRVTRSHGQSVFGLCGEDGENPELARRLQSSKPTHLRIARVRSTNPAAYAEELIDQAWLRSDFENGTRGRTIGIVVNTIDLARACASALDSRIAGCSDARTLMLIGRSRPVERERRLRRETQRLVHGDAQAGTALFVIATQCIEAGSDYDFDVLITQIASIDALQQRFARLNRRGRSSRADSVILACRDEVSASARDAIYGEAARNTWEWLLDHVQRDEAAGATETHSGEVRGDRGIIDFGTVAIERRLQTEDTVDLVRETSEAPILMPAHLDLLSQTSPMPAADPEIDLYLHGGPDSGDVMIIWRADVTLDTNAEFEQSCTVLEAVPPRPQESLAVPVTTARAWLREEPASPISDLQGVVSSMHGEGKASPSPRAGRPALRWAGPQDRNTRRIHAHALRPGDLIVVPSTYGGADEMGWLASRRFAADVSEELTSAEIAVSRALQLHPALLGTLVVSDESRGEARLSDAIWHRLWRTFVDSVDRTDGADIAHRLAQIPQLPERWLTRLRRLARSKHVKVSAPSDERESFRGGILLIDLDRRLTQTAEENTPTYVSTTEQREPLFIVPPVTVQDHAHHFEASAAEAANAVFPASVARDIVLAARLSVEGHRDPRYQGYLRGGDRMASELALEPLATLTLLYDSAEESRDSRERVELPELWCPHVESVRLAESDPRLSTAHDRLLVLWLIGTLCGTGRPILLHSDPLHAGPWSLRVQIENRDWTEIFDTLMRRYGWWGLAHLESVLRLAEHRAWHRDRHCE